MSSKMKIIIVEEDSEQSRTIARLLALHHDLQVMKVSSPPVDIDRLRIEDILDLHQPMLVVPSPTAMTRKSPGKRRGRWSWLHWRFK